jgi:hypothetical protein
MFDNRRSPQGARRRISLIGALVATAALGAGVLTAAHFSAPSDAAPRINPQLPALGSNPPAGGVLTNAVPSPDAPSDREAHVRVARAPVVIRYTFDGGVHQPITDTQGGHPLHPLGQNGGALSLVPQGKGLAVQYPARCKLPRELRCPRAILEGTRDDSLNPGTRPLQYGASIMMTAADLADGANVVQKGYSVGRVSQFKLQVDHGAGHPSCVIAGPNRIYRAEPSINVADGTWHDLMCTRNRFRLTMTVDGVPRAWVRVPPNLVIANAEPLRVGGKGPSRGNDQYAGKIDNVFLAIK